jgi:hypothetical protein
MKTIREISATKINESHLDETSKDFVLLTYSGAKAQMFNYRWFITNHSTPIGIGASEDEAWDNAAERLIFI